MSATMIMPQVQVNRRYSAYRDAWRQFCTEMEALQSLSPDTASAAELESARKRANDAETLYRTRRDELAEYLITSSGKLPEPPGRFQLAQLAYRFWDEGGRRDGNADEDWYRAEALVGRNA